MKGSLSCFPGRPPPRPRREGVDPLDVRLQVGAGVSLGGREGHSQVRAQRRSGERDVLVK